MTQKGKLQFVSIIKAFLTTYLCSNTTQCNLKPIIQHPFKC